MKASDARELARERGKSRVGIQYRVVLELIKQEAEAGRYRLEQPFLYLYNPTPEEEEEIKRQLLDNGYQLVYVPSAIKPMTKDLIVTWD